MLTAGVVQEIQPDENTVPLNCRTVFSLIPSTYRQ